MRPRRHDITVKQKGGMTGTKTYRDIEKEINRKRRVPSSGLVSGEAAQVKMQTSQTTTLSTEHQLTMTTEAGASLWT